MKTQLPMRTEEPMPSGDEHRVLKFRPRTMAKPPRPGDAVGAPLQEPARPDTVDLSRADDLSRYERDRQPPDDFRHRMLANAAALAFTVALTAIGIWLAVSIADLRKTQDCVLMGRRDCAHISTPRI
jgi:hypothetical protein